MNEMRHISQEDLALYSMQALSPAQSAEVQAHLSTCPDCRASLAEVLADISLVGMSAPQKEVPEGARQRFMAAVRNTPQMGAARAKQGPLVMSAPPVRDHRSGAGWLGWLGWIVAAAAIIAAVVLGLQDSTLRNRLHRDNGEIAQLSGQAAQAQGLQNLMNALTSPEAQQVTLTQTRGPVQPVGHATYLWNSGTLVFVASHLHPVPAGKTYELWLIPDNGAAPEPAGLFRPDAQGSASVVMPPLPSGVKAKAFGVTVEPAQGSATPTLPIVMSGG